MVFKFPDWQTNTMISSEEHHTCRKIPGLCRCAAGASYLSLYLLGGLLLLVLLFSCWFSADYLMRKSSREHLIGDLLLHSQRINEAVPNAMQGNAAAFEQLEQSRVAFNRHLDVLLHEGRYQMSPPFSPIAEMPSLFGDLQQLWARTDQAASTILRLQSGLGDLAATVPEVIDGYLNGSESFSLQVVEDEKIRLKLLEMKKIFGDFQPLLIEIFSHSHNFLAARQSEQWLLAEGQGLQQHLHILLEHYRTHHRLCSWLFGGLLSAMLLILLSAIACIWWRRPAYQDGCFEQAWARRVEQITLKVTPIAKKTTQLKKCFYGVFHQDQPASALCIHSVQAVQQISAHWSVIESAARHAEQVMNQSQVTVERGAAISQDILTQMQQIDGHIRRTVGCLGRMGISTRELDDIRKSLAELAEQANILAVNLAIQAVAAGTEGQRFTVLAEQLQYLVQNSMAAIAQISAVLDRMASDMHATKADMTQSSVGVGVVLGHVDLGSNLFAEVMDASRKMIELSVQILSFASHQNQLTNSVAQDIEHIRKRHDAIEAGKGQALSLLAALTEQVELLGDALIGLQQNQASSTAPGISA